MSLRRHRLVTARQTAGHSQESLAESLGVERSTIQRWEAGETTPRAWYHPRLAAVLGLGPDELHALLHEPASPKLVLARPSVGVDHVEQVRHSLHDVIADGAGSATLDEWELTVTRHGAATKDRPAVLLLDDVAADVAGLHRSMVRHRSLSGLRRLTRVAAHLSGLMCLTLIKLDERQAFRRWARTARVAAGEVDDAVTLSWVLAQEAYGHFYSGDLAEAVTVARHAQAVVPGTPCVGAVLAAALEARAQAALDRADETRHALRHAEHLLSTIDVDVSTPSAFAYDEAQFRFHESNALTHLGDTRAAWTAQDRALELVAPQDFMDRAFTRLDRAMCLATDGDASGAASYALDTVLCLSEAERHGIINGRAREVIETVPRRHRAVAPVRELRDLLRLPSGIEGS